MIIIKESGIIISSIDFENILPNIEYSRTLTISHAYNKPIIVHGVFLDTSDVYTGSTSSVNDKELLLNWGTRYNSGLTLTDQSEQLFKHGQGDSESSPILLETNDRIISQRGILPYDEISVVLKLLMTEAFRAEKISFSLSFSYDEIV